MIKKFLIINLFLLSFFLTNSYSDNNTYMSLKNKKVNVRYGPGLDYPIKFVFNKKKCNLNWCRVETGEYKGWVLKENLWGLN